MQELTFVGHRKLEWREAEAPRLLTPGDALVRPFVASRCDGDRLFLEHDYLGAIQVGARLHLLDPSFRHAPDHQFSAPFAYGHEGVAEVIACGEDVKRFTVGAKVVVPWALSCGSCHCCTAGLTSSCDRAPGQHSAYGFAAVWGKNGGMVSDVVRVPAADHMLVAVPPGVDPVAIASASDNIPDGYRCVAPGLERWPEAPVLVVGGSARSIGLYAAGLAVALGSSRVDYLDTDQERLSIAEALGARPIAIDRGASWYKRGEPPLASGYPITVDASSKEHGLRFALEALAPGGTCTSVGFFLRKGTPLPLWRMYQKGTTLHVGIAHARALLPRVLDLIVEGKFHPEKVTTLVGDWTDAPRLFREATTKSVVKRQPLH